ncbi:alpha-amylase family protein [Flavitalea sp.]|nr:alpha-amylase family protein [Flavitalea sp.]
MDVKGAATVTDKNFWYHKPLNILQTNIREIDARDYNAAAVVKYMQDTGCNVLVINAGAIVDFFQNPLPAAMVNKFMGKRDILKEITIACKAAGIRIIARIDFRGAEEEIYRKFPDWFMLNAKKLPVVTTYDHGKRQLKLYAGCYLGKHRNEYLKEQVSYIMKNYAVDGIWHNAPGAPGICYCNVCTSAYKKDTGKDLPVEPLAPADELDTYMNWKVKVADNHMAGIKKLIKDYGEDKVYCAEIFSMFGVEGRINSGIDLNNARDHFDFLVSVAFLDSGDPQHVYQDLTYANTITKFLKSMVPDREAIVLCGGNGTLHRMVSDPKIDYKIWLWQVLSAGGRYWDNYFTNIPDAAPDRRNIYDHTEVFLFVKKHERVFERHAPVANIGIYYSRPTRLSYREKLVENDRFGSEIRGVEAVLMENHIPHDFIIDDQVTSQSLEKYKLVILPNVRCMSDKEIILLKDFVRKGGNLIATYCTSLYDAEGKELNDYGLNELFGVHYAGKKENTRRDNYQYILNKKHALVQPDSSKTELLFNAGFTALCKPTNNSQVICTWVPTIQNQPPDKSWVAEFSTEFPTIVENNYGKGKVLYFSNQPDLLSYEVGHPDMRNLLLRSIRLLAGNAIPIETNAPSSVNIGLTQSLITKGQYILSLVNTTSGPVRPIRELIPVHDIRVKVRLDGKSVTRYEVMRSQGECLVKPNGQYIDIRLGKLEDFASVLIQMNV